jgi:dipeptidyl aminopeptidase/acylaminoacyl peptidase
VEDSGHWSTPEPLPVGGDNARFPSVFRHGNRLAYTQWAFDANIWRIEVSSSTGQGGSPTKFISSTRDDAGPQFSPDGKRIVFHSSRSGSYEVWVCDSDGSNPVQLTAFGGPLTGTSRWSPDARQIAFDSRAEGRHADIYVIKAEGGSPAELPLKLPTIRCQAYLDGEGVRKNQQNARAWLSKAAKQGHKKALVSFKVSGAYSVLLIYKLSFDELRHK